MTKPPKRRSSRTLAEQIVYHPPTADPELTAFKRAIGSFSLTGLMPSKTFLDKLVQRPDDHTQDYAVVPRASETTTV